MILEPPKIKSDTVSTVSPSISHEVMGPDARNTNIFFYILVVGRLTWVSVHSNDKAVFFLEALGENLFGFSSIWRSPCLMASFLPSH